MQHYDTFFSCRNEINYNCAFGTNLIPTVYSNSVGCVIRNPYFDIHDSMSWRLQDASLFDQYCFLTVTLKLVIPISICGGSMGVLCGELPQHCHVIFDMEGRDLWNYFLFLPMYRCYFSSIATCFTDHKYFMPGSCESHKLVLSRTEMCSCMW